MTARFIVEFSKPVDSSGFEPSTLKRAVIDRAHSQIALETANHSFQIRSPKSISSTSVIGSPPCLIFIDCAPSPCAAHYFLQPRSKRRFGGLDLFRPIRFARRRELRI